MNEANAFIGRTKQPTPEEVDLALGKAAPVWHSYLNWLADELGIKDQEWKSVSTNKYGWGLRMKLKKRTIVYLGPAHDCMTIFFVLGDRAIAAAKWVDRLRCFAAHGRWTRNHVLAHSVQSPPKWLVPKRAMSRQSRPHAAAARQQQLVSCPYRGNSPSLVIMKQSRTAVKLTASTGMGNIEAANRCSAHCVT